jgi:hypothetical protein
VKEHQTCTLCGCTWRKWDRKWSTYYKDTAGLVPPTTVTRAFPSTSSTLSIFDMRGITLSSKRSRWDGSLGCASGIGREEGRICLEGDPSGVLAGNGSVGMGEQDADQREGWASITSP